MHVIERGSGTPLVLLHGLGVDHRLLLPLDPTIAAAGDWRRVYLDLPGHGRSPGDQVFSSADVLVAVTDEIRARVGSAPFAILGSSFGGMLARHVAHDFGDQVLGVATVASVFIARPEDRDLPPRIILHSDAAVVSALGEAGPDFADSAVVQTREHAETFMTSVQPGLVAADPAATERIAARYPLPTVPEEASPEPFTAPALFVTGRQDQVVGYRDAWARLEHYPRATFATLDAAGHNVHLDRARVVHALVADWLDRVAVERSGPW